MMQETTTTLSYTPMPQKMALAFVTLTTVIMGYSHLVSVLPILVMYAMWLPFLFYKGEFCLRPARDIWLPFAFAFYCILTAVWSDYPFKSLYSGTQYLSMIICALIIARRVALETFVKGVAWGCSTVLLIVIASGIPLSGLGLLGSKNMVGYFSQIGIISSIFILFMSTQTKIQKLFFGLIPLALSLICLGLSHSTSSVISTTFVLGVCCIMWIAGRLPKSYRAISLFLVLALAASVQFCIYALEIDVAGEVLEYFGKDRTLTGRTDLWQYGVTYAMQHPVFGDGYNAFWVEGRPEAENLWDEFFIPTKTGFHFHNVFVQTWVDLGIVGLVFIGGLLATYFWKSIHLVTSQGARVLSVFLCGLAFMFISRAFVEVDILNAFGPGPFLFYSCFPRLFSTKTDQSETQA